MAIQINGKKVVHLGNMTIPIIKGDIGPEGKQGKQGIPGIDGKDGQTPLRGIDYWTTEDKTEIINEIDTKVQNDLQEYYKKTETYNKEEIDNKISLIPKFNIKVVDKLPTSNISEATVYLVKSGEESNNLYTEYIYANGKWEQLGTQKLDLSGFYNKDEINSMLETRDSKITALEEENRSQADRIKELEEEVEILSGDYKEGKAEGATAVVSDGLPKSKVPVTVIGNSYQETTEGYQLLDLSGVENVTRNGVTVTVNAKKGSIILNGTCTSAFLIDLILKEIISTGTIISFGVFNNKVTSTNKTQFRTNNTELKIQEKVISLDTLNAKVDNYTLQNDLTNMQVRLEVNEVYNNFEIFPMLRVGSTLGNFEPYTGGQASPNIEYKQDIEVIDNGYNEFNINAVVQGDLDTNTGEKINDSTAIQHSEYMEVDSNESYTITFNNTLTKRFFLLDKDKKVINTNTTSKDVFNFNTGDTTKYFRVKIVGVFDEKTQMVKGTEEKPFLPYGHIGLIQRGKNVFDNVFRQGNAITESHALRLYNKNNFKLKSGVTYTVSTNLDISKYKYSINLNTKPFPTSNSHAKDYGWKITSSYTFKSEGDYYLGIPIATSNGTDNIDLTDLEGVWFQVEKNEVATPYEPYKEPIVHSIDLAGNSIAKANDTIRDLLNIKANGEVNLTKKTIVINSNNINKSRSTNTSGKSRFSYSSDRLLQTNANQKLNGGFCNITSLVNSANTYNLVDGFEVAVDSSTNSVYIYLDELSEMTLAEAKTKLEELGAYFLLPLKEEYYETIPLPSIKPIEMIEGITNVFELVTNLGTTIAVTYKVSNKKKILNLEERISALESAVIGG